MLSEGLRILHCNDGIHRNVKEVDVVLTNVHSQRNDVSHHGLLNQSSHNSSLCTFVLTGELLREIITHHHTERVLTSIVTSDGETSLNIGDVLSHLVGNSLSTINDGTDPDSRHRDLIRFIVVHETNILGQHLARTIRLLELFFNITVHKTTLKQDDILESGRTLHVLVVSSELKNSDDLLGILNHRFLVGRERSYLLSDDEVKNGEERSDHIIERGDVLDEIDLSISKVGHL